jgi:hypothetical protein
MHSSEAASNPSMPSRISISSSVDDEDTCTFVMLGCCVLLFWLEIS